MDHSFKMRVSSWTFLDGPPGGMIWSFAIAPTAGRNIFACTPTGLYRSGGSSTPHARGWERFSGAPVDVRSVAFAPDFECNRSMWIGAQGQIFASFDGGSTWLQGAMPRPATAVTALSVSPDFARDGVVLAATMEDGVLRTEDGGLHWHGWNFGLYDPGVFSLVLSPHFAADGAAFAGSVGGLFYSHNSGRSWRELDFPRNAPPVLSLGISPDFVRDGTILAGTEASGLYCSNDHGRTWLSLMAHLPASCINALAVSSRFVQDRTLIAAAEHGVYGSTDGGQHWTRLVAVADAMCAAIDETSVAASAASGGIYLTERTAGEPDATGGLQPGCPGAA